jgi:hypothetical protein
MTPSALRYTAMLVLALAASSMAQAQQFSAATLQRLLQSAPEHDVRFSESRESPWLTAPLLSSGTMSSSATMLEKRTEQPQREAWRILDDRIQRVTDTGATQNLLFKDAPAAAVLANALRRAVTGDLAALEKDFRMTLGGDETLWTVQLTPRVPEVARVLKHIELQGSGGRLLVIVILESQGNRTTTRLLHTP